MTQADIPVVDIASFRRGSEQERVAIEREVSRACQGIGFLVVGNHGVAPDLLADIRTVSQEFFDLPTETKMRVRSTPGSSLGYVPGKSESLSATMGLTAPPDLKEMFDIARPDHPVDEYYDGEMGRYFFRPFTWPEEPSEFQAVWTAYYDAMENLAATIMELFAGALDLDRDFFKDKMDRSVNYLRAINYPEQSVAPQPGQLRAGEHTDYGTLTILSTDDAPGGLEVRRLDGSWAAVPHIPGTFVINIGDMMSMWTSDRWVSTVHRVVNPDENSGASARRLSIAFFQNPNYDAIIEPIGESTPESVQPSSGAQLAGEWLRAKQDQQRVSS